MMAFFWRILFSTALVVAAGAAEVPSCRAMKQNMTQCNPYDTSFLKITAPKRSAASLRHSPVTQKNPLIAERLRVKNGMTLHNLVSKYIKREERLYYRLKKKKAQQPKPEKTSQKPQRKVQKEKVETSQKDIGIPPPKKILQEQKPETPKKEVQKPAPLPIPKIVVLQPEVKPVSVLPEVEEDNKSSDSQLPAETILPAEPLPDPQEKHTDINQSLETEYAVYRVKKGDSLLGIAKQFGVETEILIKINKLRKDTLLKEGQKLHIPLPQEDVDAIDNATYIVKKGDTLSRISRHFHVKVRDLKKYNKIRKKSIIHIGQVLVLPLPKKLIALKRIEEKKRQIALKKKRERERLARIALKKAERKKFLRLSKGLKRKLSVTATAYTSHRGQTDKTPFLAAWNNRIRPGMKIIAVSRDLITRYGITNGKKVRISGLSGIYTVRDKMNKKWRRKIDIYMGTSRWRALRWGRRRVTLYY